MKGDRRARRRKGSRDRRVRHDQRRVVDAYLHDSEAGPYAPEGDPKQRQEKAPEERPEQE